MYLDVLLAVDIHVDERAKSDQTLPHLHVVLPAGQNENSLLCDDPISSETFKKLPFLDLRGNTDNLL